MSFEPQLPDEIRADAEVTLRPSFDTPPEQVHALIQRNLDHLAPFMAWATPDYDLAGVKSFQQQKREQWNESGEQAYSILFNGELAGAIGIRGLESPVRAVTLGYWLSEHLQGSGIMTRSIAAVVNLVFSAHHMNQVIIRAAPHNTRSRAIPERLGFKETGFERQMSINLAGELLDLVTYSLLRSEWEQSPG